MRRVPADPKYDFAFLITEDHLQKYKKEELINFILEFIQGIDKEISEMKLAIINQSRIAASYYANSLANNNNSWSKLKVFKIIINSFFIFFIGLLGTA